MRGLAAPGTPGGAVGGLATVAVAVVVMLAPQLQAAETCAHN
ncbi:hypothetical protein [Streptomyces chartreusis]